MHIHRQMLAEEESKLDSDRANDGGISLNSQLGGDDVCSMKLKSTRKKTPLNLANPKKNLDDTICKNSSEMKCDFKCALKTCVTE